MNTGLFLYQKSPEKNNLHPDLIKTAGRAGLIYPADGPPPGNMHTDGEALRPCVHIWTAWQL